MKNLKVMISGLPGNMPTLIAVGILKQKDMVLSEVGLSHTKQGTFLVKDKYDAQYLQAICLVPESGHKDAIATQNPDIIVDFAKGDLLKRCQMYCELDIPFVMGSTGGDLIAIKSLVEQSHISAVFAPNMAPPIVVIQSMFEHAAQNFPGFLDDYSLKIAESHQKGKADTSGTAIAFEKLFNEMGAISDKDGILSIRDPLIQSRILGISKQHLNGHGYHKYDLVSNDDSVHIALIHNIDGRNVYVDGTIKAVRFMAYKLGVKGIVYSMVDVLKKS